ncbi:MAG: hypothetical protein ACKV2T_25740 [Kofleriaceae bacterium]
MAEPTEIDGVPQLAWFADRQLEDAAAWMQNVPPPQGTTLREITEKIVGERERARRVSITLLVPFIHRSASLFLGLSVRGLDPVGYPLRPDAQLDIDPSIERRLELTRWARAAGHAICLRGHMLTMTIPIQAVMPDAVQLIAAELGHGGCGGMVFLLRAVGPADVPPLSPAPAMFCLFDDDIEERGARFERWLGRAYAHAMQAWRLWS